MMFPASYHRDTYDALKNIRFESNFHGDSHLNDWLAFNGPIFIVRPRSLRQ